MDAKFGVVNIPNAIWINERGTIVRPAEPAWPGPAAPPPARPNVAIDAWQQHVRELVADRIVTHRQRYANAVRDWAANGARSRFVLSPEEVVGRSRPRPLEVARAAAHFELAQYLWTAGNRDGAVGHYRAAHRLQPDNWTYKRQAWSLISVETNPGPGARLRQWPSPEHVDAWPFESDFGRDLERLRRGDYYPDTLPAE
jgi:hypothetical protein